MSINEIIFLNMTYLNNVFLPLFFPHPLSCLCPLIMLMGSIRFFFISYGNCLVNVYFTAENSTNIMCSIIVYPDNYFIQKKL